MNTISWTNLVCLELFHLYIKKPCGYSTQLVRPLVDSRLLLRIWAPRLNKPVSAEGKQRLKDKAEKEKKVMVKVTISKTSGKKSVMGP